MAPVYPVVQQRSHRKCGSLNETNIEGSVTAKMASCRSGTSQQARLGQAVCFESYGNASWTGRARRIADYFIRFISPFVVSAASQSKHSLLPIMYKPSQNHRIKRRPPMSLNDYRHQFKGRVPDVKVMT